MESLQKFNQFIENLSETKNDLLNQKEKLSNLLAALKQEVTLASSLGDINREQQAEATIITVNDKIKEVNWQLSELNVEPLAQDVINEAEVKLGKLQAQATELWGNMLDARIVFLKKVEELGELRRKSQEVCWQTQNATIALRKQPLADTKVIKFNGQHNLIVDLPLLNRLLKI